MFNVFVYYQLTNGVHLYIMYTYLYIVLADFFVSDKSFVE